MAMRMPYDSDTYFSGDCDRSNFTADPPGKILFVGSVVRELDCMFGKELRLMCMKTILFRKSEPAWIFILFAYTPQQHDSSFVNFRKVSGSILWQEIQFWVRLNFCVGPVLSPSASFPDYLHEFTWPIPSARHIKFASLNPSLSWSFGFFTVQATPVRLRAFQIIGLHGVAANFGMVSFKKQPAMACAEGAFSAIKIVRQRLLRNPASVTRKEFLREKWAYPLLI
jgi:hypothetical protein